MTTARGGAAGSDSPARASRVVSPAACVALKNALTSLYWYKSDLRSFLSATLKSPELLATLDWDDYKRNIVGQLVDNLSSRQDRYQGELLHLMTEVSRATDFAHLERLDNGRQKADAAKSAVRALQKHTKGHSRLREEQEQAEERRRHAHEDLLRKASVRRRVDELSQDYLALLSESDTQKRGYDLERLLRGLFELFDLDPRASFRITGEQIDGAFTFEGTDYLLEVKWQRQPCSAADIDVLAGKLTRKLENTLGLFLSVNGFSEDGVAAHSSGRRLVILMDGSDLMAVLEGRIDLVQLLLRKRREAAQTGNIYLRIHEIL